MFNVCDGDKVGLGNLDPSREISGRDPHSGAKSFSLGGSGKFRHETGRNDATIFTIETLHLGDIGFGHREKRGKKYRLLRGNRKVKRCVLLLSWRRFALETLKQEFNFG